MYDDNGNVIHAHGGGRFNAIIYLKKMRFIFIKPVKTCDKHNPEFYQNTKTMRCLFWNTHRNEARGLGLFFSIIANNRQSMEDFNFVTEVGNFFNRFQY
jgi:coproporphyrinogen III oxidase